MPRAIAHLEQALAARAAAAREAVAAVFAGERDPELLEPVDRRRRLRGQHLDEPRVSGLVRALEDVRGVELGRVVGGERGLDPALRLRRVAGLDRALGDEADARTGSLGAESGGETGGAAADDEHVKGHGFSHGRRTVPRSYLFVA